MTFLSGKDLADKIKAVIKGTNPRCAVAFWGKGSLDLFTEQGKKEVRIICDLTSGGTNPTALTKLKDTTQLKHYDNLHAKIYISDIGCVICSANASDRALGFNYNIPQSYEAGYFFSSNKEDYKNILAEFEKLWNSQKAQSPTDSMWEEAIQNLKQTSSNPIRKEMETQREPLEITGYVFVNTNQKHSHAQRNDSSRMKERGLAQAFHEKKFHIENIVKSDNLVFLYESQGAGIVGYGIASNLEKMDMDDEERGSHNCYSRTLINYRRIHPLNKDAFEHITYYPTRTAQKLSEAEGKALQVLVEQATTYIL